MVHDIFIISFIASIVILISSGLICGNTDDEKLAEYAAVIAGICFCTTILSVVGYAVYKLIIL